MKSRFVRSFVGFRNDSGFVLFCLFASNWKKTKKLNETQKISSETLVGANTSFRFPECIFYQKKNNSFSRKWIDWLEKPFPCVEVVPKKTFSWQFFTKNVKHWNLKCLWIPGKSVASIFITVALNRKLVTSQLVTSTSSATATAPGARQPMASQDRKKMDWRTFLSASSWGPFRL